jgi:GT2 family glycosyltransferase
MKEAQYVSGAAMMVRKETIKKVGLLDEDYFFGFEDVDFCHRVKKEGEEVLVSPDTLVEHKIGATIGTLKNQKVYYLIRNNLIFVKKRFPFYQRYLGYLFVFALSFKIFLKNPTVYPAIYFAWIDFLENRFGKLREQL